MKLTDINAVTSSALNAKMQEKLGWSIKFENLNTKNASVMLENVNSKLNDVRSSSKFQTSEKDARYTGMLMAQQVLETFIAENTHSGQAAYNAIKRRITMQRVDLLRDYGPEAVLQAMEEVADRIGNVEEIGSSDVSIWVERVANILKSSHVTEGKKAKLPVKSRYGVDKNYGNGNGAAVYSGDAKKKTKSTAKKVKEDDVIVPKGKFDKAEVKDKVGKMSDMKIKKLAKKATTEGLNERDAYECKCAKAEMKKRGIQLTESWVRRKVLEDQVTQAQSVIAAKDMVDSIQDMLEKISKMMNEQLMPLSDSIRANIGENEASAFQSSASSALDSLLQATQTAREAVNNAVLGLTGETPVTTQVPGGDMGGDMGGEPPLDVDAGDDEFGASDAAAGGEMPLGREKRA